MRAAQERSFASDDGTMLLYRHWPAVGASDRALILFRESFETNRRLLGEDHPNTASGRGNVASVLSAKGQYAEAEAMYQASLDADRKVFGVSPVADRGLPARRAALPAGSGPGGSARGNRVTAGVRPACRS